LFGVEGGQSLVVLGRVERAGDRDHGVRAGPSDTVEHVADVIGHIPRPLGDLAQRQRLSSSRISSRGHFEAAEQMDEFARPAGWAMLAFCMAHGPLRIG
jgi:hypothetical protein